ncbi:MAG TPA: alpha/beta hydrolase [Stellaceae bacterium]|jgi:pimeloyl-ACP methyl ester carboxylesterase|nr:alpha/beta hydrolase [Stellaceae bacterium]
MLSSEKIKLKNGRSWQVYTGGSGPKLVWLHGLTGIMPADPLLAALERRHSVIAPVAPGFNDLAEIDEIGNIHELALDYDDLLEHFQIEGATLAGHSFGAMAAAEVAAHFPRRAKQLVLMAPVGLWNDAYPVTDVFAEPYMTIENMLWADNAARETHAARSRSNEAGPNSEAERMIAVAQSLTAITKFTWPIPEKGLKKRLPRIAAKTLLLFGEKDGFISPRYAEDFQRGLPSAQISIIKGAGHMLPYERTDEVAGMVETFLAG